MSQEPSNEKPKKLSRDAAHRRIINWYLVNHLISTLSEIERSGSSLKELAKDVTAELELFAERNGACSRRRPSRKGRTCNATLRKTQHGS